MTQDPIHVKIAEFILALIVPKDVPFVLDGGFEGFLAERERETERVDLTTYCHVGCANAPKIWGKELYCARNGEHALWTIYEADGGICIHVNDSEELTRLQHIAFYQEEKQEWTIYSDLNENQELESLRYPMLPLILYYLTTKTESLLVHASGVFDGEHGRIFSGFSGVGKSTMAGLWQSDGAQVINDDRLMLRKLDGRWWMFNNTPQYQTKDVMELS